MKKKLTLVLIALLSLICVFAIGCNPGDKIVDVEPEKETIEMDASETMLLGDTQEILLTYNKKDGMKLEWTSSNTAVAIVENGYVTAVSEGTAEISVRYGQIEDSYTLTVVRNNIMPVLKFNLQTDNEGKAYVNTKEKINVKGYIKFGENPKNYLDYEPNYTVEGAQTVETDADENTIFKASNGEVICKISKIGEFSCNVARTVKLTTAVESWHGIETPTLFKTFEIVVRDLNQIIVDKGLTSSIELYTVSSFAGNEYKTNYKLDDVVAYHNQDSVEYKIQVVSNEQGAISYDSTTKEITATKLGNAQIEIAFADDTFSVILPVSVSRPTECAVYSELIDNFSADKGELDCTNIFEIGDKTIVEAYQGDTALTVENGRILGVQFENSQDLSQTELTVYNDKVGYKVNVRGCSYVISTTEDLNEFLNNPNKKGCYVLANDIDASNLGKIGANNAAKLAKFTGTFDGKGYSISNITIKGGTWDSTSGLFGDLIGATVKNVAFKNVTFNEPWASVIAGDFNSDSRLENVLIQVASFASYAGNGEYMGAISKNPVLGTLTNVVIEYPNMSNYYTAWGSALMGNHLLHYGSPNTDNWSNVYVISQTGVMGFYGNTSGSQIGIAENETGFTLGSTTYTVSDDMATDGKNTFASLIFKGVKRFDDRDAMAKENNDYSSFDSKYWTVAGGALYWHDTKVENISTVEQFKAFVETPVKNGLYFLTADLDLGGEKIGVCNVSQSGGFTGAFDGQGHSISNFSIKGGNNYASTEGLFGDLKSATIKNIAFKNVTLSETWSSVITGTFDANSKLENVYIQVVSFGDGEFMGAIANTAIQGTLSNVVVEYPDKTGAYSNWGSVLMAGNINSTVVNTSNWENVYIISKTGVMGNYSIAGSYYQMGIAENEIEFKHGEITYTVSGNTVNDGTNTYTAVKYTGLKRYETMAGITDTSAFIGEQGNGCWKLTSNVLAWIN